MALGAIARCTDHYTSTFNDWFSQAVIDFLGNRTLAVFSEFLLKLSSTDPRDHEHTMNAFQICPPKFEGREVSQSNLVDICQTGGVGHA